MHLSSFIELKEIEEQQQQQDDDDNGDDEFSSLSQF